jgi:hypothetical protein
MKYFILLTSLFYLSVSAAVITGSQDRVSVTGGSISVTSAGVTETVDSGEITFFGDGQAPSKARKIQKNDLNNVMNDLQAKDPDKLISIQFPNMNHKQANRLKSFLISKGIHKKHISIRNINGIAKVKLRHVNLKKIKSIYPEYHKVGERISEKFAKKNKVPLLKMKSSHIKIYHKNIFR